MQSFQTRTHHITSHRIAGSAVPKSTILAVRLAVNNSRLLRLKLQTGIVQCSNVFLKKQFCKLYSFIKPLTVVLEDYLNKRINIAMETQICLHLSQDWKTHTQTFKVTAECHFQKV